MQQYEVSFSWMLNDILTLDQLVAPQLIWLYTNFMTLLPKLTFAELRVVSMEHLQRVSRAIRERLPFRTPGFAPRPPYETYLCPDCWD